MTIIVGVFVANKMSWQGEDFSIFSIDAEKVEIVNISPERGMVNSYEIKNMEVWIPDGKGWYPVSRLGLIVKNDIELVKKIAFYNFGFWPKVVVLNGGWNNNQFMWKALGPIGWIRYRLSVDEWLWKSDILNKDNLAEEIPRDMADSEILSADIKLNVVNATGKNGFGNMVADKLEWWGMTVTSVQTRDVEKECQIYFDFNSAKQSNNFEKFELLAKIIGCKTVNREGSSELVLGTDSEEMVKYSQTYVRSL